MRWFAVGLMCGLVATGCGERGTDKNKTENGATTTVATPPVQPTPPTQPTPGGTTPAATPGEMRTAKIKIEGFT